MSGMTATVLGRAGVLLSVAALSIIPIGVARASSVPQRQTAKICAVSTACPTIQAIAKPTTTARDITKFLTQLWDVNFSGGPLGTYQLQRCENPGSAPFHIECVLFSTGSPQDLAALKNVFVASRLFESVNTNS